jgi:hypothetical protein
MKARCKRSVEEGGTGKLDSRAEMQAALRGGEKQYRRKCERSCFVEQKESKLPTTTSRPITSSSGGLLPYR